jgi:hypothetical protein
MSPLVEIGAAVASLAMVVIAVVAVRAMVALERGIERFNTLADEVRQWVGHATALTSDAREAVTSVRGVIAPIRRASDRFEALSDRTMRLSTAVLNDVEPPLRAAAAVARAVGAFAACLRGRLTHRLMNGRIATPGGTDDE